MLGFCNSSNSGGNDVAGFILRITLGFVMLPHGLQKTLGLFGGHGFSATLASFTEKMGLPWIIALMVILAESVGALGLILGFMSRFMAFSIFLVMLGAMLMVHLEHGFFMNWSGKQQGEGFEYHLLAMGLALAIMAIGGGRWSIDAHCCSKKQ